MRYNYNYTCKLVPDTVKVFLLAIILVLFSFWLRGNIGLNVSDEGFLWYGALRTTLGDIPIRDFQSYDPGRYYWAAAWAKLFGSGIISLRVAAGIFQVFGLTFGMLALRRVIRSWWMMAVAGAFLLLWMLPWFKVFDHSITLAAVYFATLLIEKPSFRRHFMAGVFVGVAAFWGRNHGLYGFAAFLLLIFFIWFKIDRSYLFKKMTIWGSGILVGYSPMLIMFVLIPGFFDSFIESVLFWFRFGHTNLPLPIPWPWGMDYTQMDPLTAVKSFSTGMFFLILPIFYILSGVFLLRSRRDALQQKAVFIAGVFIGVIYIHYAFSRAEVVHLSLAIHPFLIGLFSLPFIIKSKHYLQVLIIKGLLVVVFIMSFLSAGMTNSHYIKAYILKEEFVKVDILGDHLWLSRDTASIIDSVKRINEYYVKPSEELLIAPNRPTLYPVLQRKSPLWDIYFLFKETEERQKEMVSELKERNVNWVILVDYPLDGRDDMRFCNTHNIVWQNFMDDFEVVNVDGLPDNYQLLHRKKS